MINKNKHIGSNFDDFLKDEGILEESQAAAVKRIIAFQIEAAMKKENITKKEMTERMHMKSRMQLDRLLDPENRSVTLLTLEKAAIALGKKLRIQLV
ncbi:MAG: Fis family transcriptional regulator [Omnitrophica WOR_2 bacterium GWF2_38_59]|nr:MAG: Fis family transcriptional regulator [Omnitrophica WOR_2 bacterium GWA2_37_7]OGX24603.1 MAG: Fis family transcriptional regulator [Omnitrophica WOR_2 bacterium GWF2_38_59]OGX50566.1 MAG: Fis family transcriptional regulator [Omnitrophica WOR_2 bacterium RIFOXYA2_FULL_38_17]OGX51832.1 MAG: Fis family transcriptional regulator [Omnitrophica WOR_2 bacterium RIFOXYA12_FULL_38_10]OGX55236.1 MAG: Fis family transcriptional regulator [Omnitrophica WOR_2 bacterium RIFOXYC2_FULL_38_12]